MSYVQSTGKFRLSEGAKERLGLQKVEPEKKEEGSAASDEDLPSIEYLRECFDYNPETGVLTWKERPEHHFNTRMGWKIFNSRFAGKPAGTIHSSEWGFKRQVNVRRKIHKEHRVCFAIYHGVWPTLQVDHIDGDGLNNRIINLREVTNQENGKNIKTPVTNTSGSVGVNFYAPRNKWRAYIVVGGKQHHLGYFKNFEDAVAARKAAEIKYGFHPNHGLTPEERACYHERSVSSSPK